MDKVSRILLSVLFGRTIISCGSCEDGGAMTSYYTSSTTTTSSCYNSTNNLTAVCAVSIFDSNFYGV